MYMKDAKQAIILEDDLEVSPDFFRYIYIYIYIVPACVIIIILNQCICRKEYMFY